MISTVLGIANIACGVLMIVLAVPLLQGRIKRNVFYGVRLPEAFQSEEAWLAINRYGAKRLIFWASLIILVGVVAFFLPLNTLWASLPVALAPTIVVISVFECQRFGRRVHAEGRPEARQAGR